MFMFTHFFFKELQMHKIVTSAKHTSRGCIMYRRFDAEYIR